MVKELVRDRKGLGLTMDDVVGSAVLGIKTATTRNNKIGIIIVEERDEA